MLTLLAFAYFAGLITIISPCILPVLPPLLGIGFTSNRSKALGVILGFIVCFTIATLTLSQALQSLGGYSNIFFWLAVGFLAFFGLTLIVPPLAHKFEQWLTPIAQLGNKIAPRKVTGFSGGFLLGLALGFIWTPCAGPILATIIVLATLHSLSWTTFFLLLFYSLGVATSMFALMIGGKYLHALFYNRPKIAATLRTLFGILVLASALALATGANYMLQSYADQYIPFLSIENNALVQKRLGTLIREASNGKMDIRTESLSLTDGEPLPIIGPAPALPVGDEWISSAPLTMDELKGKVVLIDFWTYSCINCLRTLPYLQKWYSNYSDDLVIIGVHTPEFAFEKNIHNVEDAVKRYRIPYPVVLDNDYAIWKAYGNLYWPAKYLIDKEGNIRYYHFGEGEYIQTENAIRQLLGLKPLEGVKEMPSKRALTPEIYLGSSRAQNYPLELDLHSGKEFNFRSPNLPEADQVTLEGAWIVEPEYIISMSHNSYIYLNYTASNVHIVLSGRSKDPVTIQYDGKPLPMRYYTQDMNAKGEIYLDADRKYAILNMKKDYGRHTLRVHVPQGVKAYTFTFGN